MARRIPKQTIFLNVDLEIVSHRDLQPFADQVTSWAFALHVGTSRGKHRPHFAHFELTREAPNAELVIRRFVQRLERLPAPAARLWRTATRRTFNIGVQAGATPHALEFTLSAELLRRVVALGASVTFTVYAPDRPQGASA